MNILAENRKALFNYKELEKFHAGIALTGQEVKSIRSGRLGLAGSFVTLKGEEVFWIGAHIPPYQPKNLRGEYNPERTRKLLLTKPEIKRLTGQVRQKGLTMIPTKVYTDGNKIKLEFVLAKGRSKIDKREKIKKRETEREIQRIFKR
ncbi:MAG: SsrA-binding protein SmpB [Candidatus Pacebacteria bacterium]|nr:SsrA-binding protein SmpB [Candidatus Paceibacterota bacterium]